jgi:hypothetical protein
MIGWLDDDPVDDIDDLIYGPESWGLTGEAPRRPTLPLFRSGDPTLAEHVDEASTGFGQ